jgi:hypothetical protein
MGHASITVTFDLYGHLMPGTEAEGAALLTPFWKIRERRRMQPELVNTLRGCQNPDVTKADLHDLVDRLPDGAVDGAVILLEEITDGRIDPEQAWFWTQEWQQREREADEDLAAGRVTRFENDEDFLAALDERTKPLDADA